MLSVRSCSRGGDDFWCASRTTTVCYMFLPPQSFLITFKWREHGAVFPVSANVKPGVDPELSSDYRTLKRKNKLTHRSHLNIYSLHSRVKFTTRIRIMGGASARQLQSRCKMYSCFCKSTKMYIQLRVPTYNHNYFVLHCCFRFSASTRNDVTARASS